MSRADARRRAAALGLLGILMAPLVGALALAPVASAFDPGQIANTANDPAWNLSMASEFRLNLENVTPYACPVVCTLTQSDEVNITIAGPRRLTGTFSETYQITVRGPPSFGSNYTTIAAVVKGNASDVVLQTDSSAERTGAQAYTKDVNGSAAMSITLLPSNRSGNITLNVIGYVGNGNRTHHNNSEVYAIASLPIEMRPLRMIPLNVTVANRANVSVTGVNVSFWAQGPRDSDFALVGNASLAALSANGQGDVGVAWDATWADPEVYTIKVVIDPLHQHPDIFEEDNVAFYRVNLGPPEPDTRGEAIGRSFLVATVVIFVAIAAGLWIYNRRYE